MGQRIERCRNLTHTKMNVAVRFCPSCGEIVNRNLPSRPCNDSMHSKRLKDRNNFCVDCGKSLFLKR